MCMTSLPFHNLFMQGKNIPLEVLNRVQIFYGTVDRQPKRVRQPRNDVPETKGASWEETRHLSRVWFPVSAGWKISPWKQRGYWEKERRVAVHNEVCARRERFVYVPLCVSGNGSCGIWALTGKKEKCLALEWLRWGGKRLSNPLAGCRDLPGQIYNSEQPPWVWKIGFPRPQQVAATEAASVIRWFWRRQC